MFICLYGFCDDKVKYWNWKSLGLIKPGLIKALGLIMNRSLRTCFLFFTFFLTSHNFHYCTLPLSSRKFSLYPNTVSVNTKNYFPSCFKCPPNESFSINDLGLFYALFLFHLALLNNSTIESSSHILILSVTITFHFF